MNYRTVDEITRTMYGHDPDFVDGGPLTNREAWPDLYRYSFKDFVFIYTYSHDGSGEFSVIDIPLKTVPPRDQQMLLELNSDDLTEDRRHEIHEVIFGPFTRLNKYNYRTTFHVFIGKLEKFTEHLLDNSSRDHLMCMLFQLLEYRMRQGEVW